MAYNPCRTEHNPLYAANNQGFGGQLCGRLINRASHDIGPPFETYAGTKRETCHKLNELGKAIKGKNHIISAVQPEVSNKDSTVREDQPTGATQAEGKSNDPYEKHVYHPTKDDRYPNNADKYQSFPHDEE